MRPGIVVALLITGCFAAAAFADMGGSSRTPMPSSSSSSTPDAMEQQNGTRQEAERDYGDAYSEIAKAKRNPGAKDAGNRYQKALDRAHKAVELDSTYYEAWNLIGYSSRMLGKYDESLAGYQKSLAIKPDYAPAREYLGETYLAMNQPDQARQQFALLQQQGAKDAASELGAAIDTYVSAHPEAMGHRAAADSSATAAAPATGAAAPADSAATK